MKTLCLWIATTLIMLTVSAGCSKRDQTAVSPASPADSASDADASIDAMQNDDTVAVDVAAEATSTAKCIPTPQPGPLLCDDGACWVAPQPQGWELRDVWISPEKVAWVVGERGTLLTRTLPDGKWSYSQFDSRVDLLAVTGTSSCDVWIGGVNRTLQRWNGKGWSSIALPAGPTNEAIVSLCMSGEGQVIVAGDTGRLYTVSESLSEEMETPWTLADGKHGLWQISCRPGGPLWLVGSAPGGDFVARRNVGEAWKVWKDWAHAWSIWDDGEGRAWATAWQASMPTSQMIVFSGDSYQSKSFGAHEPVTLFGQADNDIWLTTTNETMLYWDGQEWTSHSPGAAAVPCCGGQFRAGSVRGTEGMMVGSNGYTEQLKSSTWQLVSHSLIWNAGPIAALPDGSVVLGGNALVKMDLTNGSISELADGSGDVLAADTTRVITGGAGGLGVLENGAWKLFDFSGDFAVRAIGLIEGGPAYASAVGWQQSNNGQTLFYQLSDGKWNLKTNFDLKFGKIIHVYSADKVWVMGPKIWNWNGVSWSVVAGPPDFGVGSMAVGPDGVVWLANSVVSSSTDSSKLFYGAPGVWKQMDPPRSGNIVGLAFSKGRLVVSYEVGLAGDLPKFYFREATGWVAVKLPDPSNFPHWTISADGRLVVAGGYKVLTKVLDP